MTVYKDHLPLLGKHNDLIQKKQNVQNLIGRNIPQHQQLQIGDSVIKNC